MDLYGTTTARQKIFLFILGPISYVAFVSVSTYVRCTRHLILKKIFFVREGGKYGLNPNNCFGAGISMGSHHGPEAAMGLVLLISTLETTESLSDNAYRFTRPLMSLISTPCHLLMQIGHRFTLQIKQRTVCVLFFS